MSILKVAKDFQTVLVKKAHNNYLALRDISSKSTQLNNMAPGDVPIFSSYMAKESKNFLWKAYSEGVSAEEMTGFKGKMERSLDGVLKSIEEEKQLPPAFYMTFDSLSRAVKSLTPSAIPAQKPKEEVKEEPRPPFVDKESELGVSTTPALESQKQNPYSPEHWEQHNMSGQGKMP